MKYLVAAICLAFAATGAFAQDKKDAKKDSAKSEAKKDEKKPSAAQKEQRDKMKACNKQASDKKMKGEERQKFMSGCLKG